MWAEGIVLRPHHGLCMAYFVGEGYSSGFKKHMGEVLSAMTPQTPIILACRTDELCSACPHNREGTCEQQDNVNGYDQAVLKACCLEAGQQLTFEQFTSIVQERIISAGLRESICGLCQWNAICAATPSRWEHEGDPA